MSKTNENKSTTERRRDRKLKDKLLNGFEHLRLLLMERRKIGTQDYFAKMTPRILLIIAFVFSIFSMVLMGYFDVSTAPLGDLVHTNIRLGFFVGMALAIAAGLVMFEPKQLFKMLYIWIPVIILLFTLEYFIGNDVVSLVFSGIIGFGFGLITLGVLFEFLLQLSTPSRFVIVLITIGLFLSVISLNDMLQDLLGFGWTNKYLVPVIFLVISYILMVLLNNTNKEKEAMFIGDEKINVIPFVSAIVIIFIIFFSSGVIIGLNNALELKMGMYPHLAFGLGTFAAVTTCALLFMYSRKALYSSIIIYFIMLLSTFETGIFYLLYHNLSETGISFLSFIFVFCSSLTLTFGFIFGFVLMGKLSDDNPSKKIIRIFLLFLGCFFAGMEFLQTGLTSCNIKTTLVVSMIVTSVLFFFLIQIDIKRIVSVEREKTPVKEITDSIEEKKYKIINPDLVLTKKEMQVFRLLVEGYSLKQIAETLDCKYDAINFHYKNVYKKLDVNTKLELILRYGKDTNRNN